MKKGEITKDEFKHRVKVGAIAVFGGIACGSGGAAIGFLIGTAILPGILSIPGTVIGGVIGGLTGRKVSVKAYEKSL